MTIDDTSWRQTYADALLELDGTCLRSKIENACAAIREAKRELEGDRSVLAVEETRAMDDALHNLQTLRRIEFRTTTAATSPAPAPAEG